MFECYWSPSARQCFYGLSINPIWEGAVFHLILKLCRLFYLYLLGYCDPRRKCTVIIPFLVYVNTWWLMEMFLLVTSYKSQYLTKWPFNCGIITLLHLLLNLTILQSLIYIYIHILRSCLWGNHMFWVLTPAFAFPLRNL